MLGGDFGKGNIVIGGQYTERGSAIQADRGFSDCPIFEDDNAEKFCAGSDYAEGGHVWGETADLSGRGGEYHDFGDADYFDWSKASFLRTPMNSLNVTMAAEYDITDTTTFFVDSTYTKRWSKQQMAPQPIWNSETWVYNPMSAGGNMTDDLLPWVAPGEGLDYGRRMIDSGPRKMAQNVDTVRLVVGLEGYLENDWDWSVSLTKGKNDSTNETANLHNIGSINDAVQAGEFDPFTQESWQGDSIAPFVYTEGNSGGSELDLFAATLTGELFELPSGMLAFAAGVERREESAFYSPDSLTAQGLANDPRTESTAGSFSVNEAYVEFAIPLLFEHDFAKNLEVSAAARYFDYSTFGSDMTWKLGLTWKLNDMFMLRGVASTAFRAPTVDELFGGASPSFDQINHAATTQSQAEVTIGGNSMLTPEEADVFTIGAVIEPIDNLSITVDYYNIDITNAINTVDSDYIANTCLDASGNNINSNTALCQSAGVEIDGTGRVSFDNGLQNLGGQATSGIDFNASYVFQAYALDWRVGVDTSIITKFDQIDQDGNTIDLAGFITGSEGSYAKLKSNLSVLVTGTNWDASYEMRYIDGMDSFTSDCQTDPALCAAPTVDAIVYHDVHATYFLSDTITLSGGINNLLDEAAPYYTGNNDANTDPTTYDTIGRYMYVKASFSF